MATSDLALSYDDIRQRVGQERGYGRVIADWAENGDATEIIEDCLRDGSRMFYLQANHEWSFLSPLHGMTIRSGAVEVELPDDFGFMVDDIYFDSSFGPTIRIQNDGQILLKRNSDVTSTGRPSLGAVVADGAPTVNKGQTFKLIFWPTADADYGIQVRYSVNPKALGPNRPFPYGGTAHSKTLLEACLAASEAIDGQPGLHTALYAQSLELSKAFDRKLKPRTLGRSDRRRYQVEPSVVTYVP